ncbi:MAG: DivIVA domain-containing protein [Gemmatimonadota bacterium]
MIDLTPLDVRKKKEDFRRAMRGYDAEQVNAFLDVVAERLAQLVSENGTLGERLATLEERLTHYKERERALNEALLAAQELREEARSQAERDAAVRLREAETHAEAVLLEADQAIRHSQRRLKEIRAQRAHLLRALRGMVERFTEHLQLEESRLLEEPRELEDLAAEREGATSPDGSTQGGRAKGVRSTSGEPG